MFTHFSLKSTHTQHVRQLQATGKGDEIRRRCRCRPPRYRRRGTDCGTQSQSTPTKPAKAREKTSPIWSVWELRTDSKTKMKMMHCLLCYNTKLEEQPKGRSRSSTRDANTQQACRWRVEGFELRLTCDYDSSHRHGLRRVERHAPEDPGEHRQAGRAVQ